jgi:hypothetical protein
MKAAIIAGSVVLLLATGMAHASSYHAIQPDRWFRQTDNGDWYFHGKLCPRIPCDKIITLQPCDN